MDLTDGRRSAAWFAVLVAGVTLVAAVQRANAEDLPADVLRVIRQDYVSPDAETRYLAGRVDLNADGQDEILVHVVGRDVCGTGGCPTLVFTPAGRGYRLVATISVSRTPIRAATARAHGWRSVVVRVAGGGAAPRDVALAFDGASYPTNPTVPGPRVTTADADGAATVIADFKEFTDATPLPAAASAPAKAAAPQAGGPSFDCGKAATPVEKAICRDGDLAALDHTLADAYTRAMREWPADEQTKQRAAQRAWMTRRNGCAQKDAIVPCVAAAYRRRLVEVQIQSGQLEAPMPVDYACDGHARTPLTAAFYQGTDPASVVLTFGDRQTIATAEPTGSGARYVGPDVDFWEHHGEATLTWSGVKYVCKRG